MIVNIIGWAAVTMFFLLFIGSVSAAIQLNDALNSNILIGGSALFLIAAAICFK